jgi:hypothetical protein
VYEQCRTVRARSHASAGCMEHSKIIQNVIREPFWPPLSALIRCSSAGGQPMVCLHRLRFNAYLLGPSFCLVCTLILVSCWVGTPLTLPQAPSLKAAGTLISYNTRQTSRETRWAV